MKPGFEERVEDARKLAPYKGNIKKDTLEMVKKCVKSMGIESIPELVRLNEVPPYDNMPKDNRYRKTS